MKYNHFCYGLNCPEIALLKHTTSIRGGDIEETAYPTHLEASDELARQLRLRDLGGLIVIDYIDMLEQDHQRDVVRRLDQALTIDRARTQVGEISRFGLLEMSRQRLRPSLGDATRITCPRCMGQGTIRGTESFALSIMRLIEENVLKENTHTIRAQLPVEVATYIINEKRKMMHEIETRHQVKIVVIPNKYMEQPNYIVERIRRTDIGEIKTNRHSYELVDAPEVDKAAELLTTDRFEQEQAALKSMPKPTYEYPSNTGRKAASNKSQAQSGVFRRVVKFLFGEDEVVEAPKQKRASSNNRRRSSSGNNNRRSNGNGNRSSSSNNNNRRSNGNNNQQRRRNNNSNRNASGNNNQRKNAPNRSNNNNSNNSSNNSSNKDNTPNDNNVNANSNNANNNNNNTNGNRSNNRNRGNRSHQGRRRRGGQNQGNRTNASNANAPANNATPPAPSAPPASSSEPKMQQVETKKD